MGSRALAVLCILFVFFGQAISQKSSELSGTVYDPYGAVVVGAKVTALATDGKKFLAVTDDRGVYRLTLPYNPYVSAPEFRISRYDLVVESLGFRRSETKGYAFIPSQFGKMTLDIGLEVLGPQSVNKFEHSASAKLRLSTIK